MNSFHLNKNVNPRLPVCANCHQLMHIKHRCLVKTAEVSMHIFIKENLDSLLVQVK